MDTLLSEADRARIREAVGRAEGRTSGEIVPYIVSQSADYDVAIWRGASLASLLVLFVALLVVQLYDGWGMSWLYTNWAVAVLVLGAGTVGALLSAFSPAMKRALAGSSFIDQMVHRRAMQAFVEEEVFNTRDRTGILLFMSLLEHRIEVVGDAGINRKVAEGEWADVVLRIREGIKNDRLADGLVEAIDLCGVLLEREGVEIRPDDVNELSDDVRFGSDD